MRRTNKIKIKKEEGGWIKTLHRSFLFQAAQIPIRGTRVTFSRPTILYRGKGRDNLSGHVQGGSKRARSTASLTRSSGLKRRRSQPGRVVSIVRLRRVFPAPTRRTSRSLVSLDTRRNCKSPLVVFRTFHFRPPIAGLRILSTGRCLREVDCHQRCLL